MSPGDLYVVFGYTDLKNSCESTENVPSWFDWVWYIVWYSVDVYVRMVILKHSLFTPKFV